MNILLCNEMGAGYGHLCALRAAAKELVAERHACLVAASDPAAAATVLRGDNISVALAPRQASVRGLAHQFSHSSLLYTGGLCDPVDAARRIEAWMDLMALHQVDRIVADYAPLALVAARLLDIRRTVMGCGFDVPPLRDPFPAFPSWAGLVDDATLRRNDRAVVDLLNEALGLRRLPRFERLQDIYEGARRALLTYPALDHYGARPKDADYLGFQDDDFAYAPLWPTETTRRRPRIFAYLAPVPRLDDALCALKRIDADVLLRVRDIGADYLEPFLSPRIVVAPQQINLRQAAAECDAWLTYGCHGTACEMLLAGKPGVALPDTLERELVGLRLARMGSAVVAPVHGAFDVLGALDSVLEAGSSYAIAARVFAGRHQGEDRAGIPARLAEIILS